MKKQDSNSITVNIENKRRAATRQSGHKSHPDAKGNDLLRKNVISYKLIKGDVITVTFEIENLKTDNHDLIGFGGWFYINDSNGIKISTINVVKQRKILIHDKNWHAFGSLEVKNYRNCFNISNPVFTFTALKDVDIAFYELCGGIVEHYLMTRALREKTSSFKDIHIFAPEANFIKHSGKVHINSNRPLLETAQYPIFLKSCDRCNRFLPINFPDERNHISFTNHCVTTAPCTHTSFGTLRDIGTGDSVDLYNGFQRECRFCKKFTVNDALNNKRTSSQYKEDGARRRAIEKFLEVFYGKSIQLSYRAENDGRELTDDIWNRFGGRCFNCNMEVFINRETKSSEEMALDHTRPLSLLWPLDATATCLCKACNNSKGARTPADFYTKEQLSNLSQIIGMPLKELEESTVNIKAVEDIINDLGSLMAYVHTTRSLNTITDNKHTGKIFLKSLQGVFDLTEYKGKIDLLEEYDNYVNDLISSN